MRTVSVVLSLCFVGCANGTVDRDSGRLTRIDTGLSLVDAGHTSQKKKPASLRASLLG